MITNIARETHSNKLEVHVTGLTRQQWANTIARELSKLAGGCHVTNGAGYWINESNDLEHEPVLILTTSTNQDMDSLLENVSPILTEYLVKSGEQALYLTVNNQARVIYASDI